MKKNKKHKQITNNNKKLFFNQFCAFIIILLASFDISRSTKYLLSAKVPPYIPIYKFILIFINIWYMRNIAFKASVYLWGESSFDGRVIGICSKIITSLKDKMKDSLKDKEDEKK